MCYWWLITRRKSVHSYKFSASSDAPDAIEAPASQTETVTESQTTQDDVHGSAHEMTTEPVSSRSSQDAIPDISAREGHLSPHFQFVSQYLIVYLLKYFPLYRFICLEG